MKRVCSYALISILLLNVMGYYGIFVGLKYRNETSVMKAMDANRYDESETITLKVPISVPYYMDNDAEFKRVDGKFEHQGQVYRLVKQKYSNDTLTVICLRDTEDTRIEEAMTQLAHTYSESTDSDQNSEVTITFIKDYLPQGFALKTVSYGWVSEVAKDGYHSTLIASFTTSVTHPPEVRSV